MSKQYGWTDAKMMQYHKFRRAGLSCKAAAMAALRGWTIAK